MTTNTGARRDRRWVPRERRARRSRAGESTWDGGARGYGRRRERFLGRREEEEEDCDVYTVRYGDTLVGVARTHGTSVDAICEANPAFGE